MTRKIKISNQALAFILPPLVAYKVTLPSHNYQTCLDTSPIYTHNRIPVQAQKR